MPQVSAAVLRSMPSSTSASASIRRAAALFFSPPAALRSSDAVRSSRVIDTAAPIDAAPLKRQQRVTVSGRWYKPFGEAEALSPAARELGSQFKSAGEGIFDDLVHYPQLVGARSCHGQAAQD